jgi:MAF protein
MKLILSSTSPARRSLLNRLQLPFEIVSPHVDESPLPNETIENMFKRLALIKSEAAASSYTEAYIIGADTVGTVNNHILSKPMTRDNAIKQLQTVSGKCVRFYTGLCLYDSSKHTSQLAVEIYDVHFRELTLKEIKNYLEKEDVLECAGAFQSENLGITLVEKFEGDDYTTLIGLPLIRLSSMLRKVGLLIE